MNQPCCNKPPFGEKFMQEFLFGPPPGKQEKVIVEPVPKDFCKCLVQTIQAGIYGQKKMFL